VLSALARLPLRLLGAVGRLLRKTAKLAALGAVVTVVIFVLDMVFLGDKDRDQTPPAG
jgi:hypothetical protein